MDTLPKRKHPRLKEYDYSQNGCYYVTICTDKRQHLLGEITVEEIAHDVCRGGALLRPLGIMVEEEIENLQNRYAVTIDKYVIMPNHIHILFCVEQNRDERAEQSPAPTLGDMVCALKSITTKRANLMDKTPGRKLWQRSYYDHVIRSEADYLRIWQYIDENPAKWAEDEYYS